MKSCLMRVAAATAVALTSNGAASAGSPLTIAGNQASMLKSDDAHLASNKRLAYDFWRIVLEAGHVEQIDRFLSPNFVQHNPNLPDGSRAFARLIQAERPHPGQIQASLHSPLLSIVAEGDMVALFFAVRDRGAPGNAPYSTTRFDLYRVAGGRLTEHWDPEMKGHSLHSAALARLKVGRK